MKHNIILQIFCAGGLLLLAGCCSYGHCEGREPAKKAKVEAARPAPDGAPIRERARMGGPDKMGMGRGMGPGMGMRGGMGMGMGQGMGQGMGGPGHINARVLLSPRVSEQIGLTDQQKNQIRDIDQRNSAKLRPLMDEQRKSMDKMRELMEAPTPDTQAVMTRVEETGDNMIEIRKLQVGEALEVRRVLTPEQFDKVRGLIRQRMERAGRDGFRPNSSADRPLPGPRRERAREHMNDAVTPR